MSEVSGYVVTKTAARQRSESGATIQVPSVDIRSTSSREKSTLPDHALGLGHEARMMWSAFPEMNVQETLRSMNEARATPSGAAEPSSDDAWRPSSPTRSRCTSAASSRTPASLSRPGSGPTRSSAQHLRNIASTQSSLLAADAQYMMSTSIGLEDVASVPRSLGSDNKDFRPHSSTFVSSLRFAASSEHHSNERPVSSLRVARHHKRTITRAPISLLKQFELRVRSATPYAPLAKEHVSDQTSPQRAHLHLPVQMNVAPRVQRSDHQPNKAFHTRGEYTADIVGNVLNELDYFSFRDQIVRDIHEKGLALKDDVEHARAERSMMAGLRHDTMKADIAFWQQHRPPNVVDLENLLPGKGNNTREVNVFVGKLVEKTRVSVEGKTNRVNHSSAPSKREVTSPPPIRWKSSKERSDYYRFIGQNAPLLFPASTTKTTTSHEQLSKIQ